MVCFRTVVVGVSLLAGVSCGLGEDWPQWRGPGRNGVAGRGPALAGAWPKAGPVKLWEYPAGSNDQGGLGSVAVAGGRAFFMAGRKYEEPVATRRLGDGELRRVGWFPDKLPEDLLAKAESARVSAERAELKPEAVAKWAGAWVNANLDAEQKKKFGPAITDRLRRGKDAHDLAALAKLTPLKGKTFDTQEALDRWLDEANLGGELRKAVHDAAVKTRPLATDFIVCLDATTGREVWKKEYPGVARDQCASCTPCVADGRVYVTGSGQDSYCLDARDGAEIWKAPTGHTQASFVVADGLAVIPSDALTALDARTGGVVWRQPKVKATENSPALWRHGEKAYLLCNTGKNLFCVELATGDIVWAVPGGLYSSAAIEGDYLAVFTNAKEAGLTAYTLSVPDSAAPAASASAPASRPAGGAKADALPAYKPVQLWSKPLIDRGASPIIHGGHVYAIGGGQAICVRLEDGAVAWQQKMGGEISSPVLADGKVIAVTDTSALVMLSASPGQFEQLGKAGLGIATCTSPALADGRLYLRLAKAVACFDLLPPPPATAPAATGKTD